MNEGGPGSCFELAPHPSHNTPRRAIGDEAGEGIRVLRHALRYSPPLTRLELAGVSLGRRLREASSVADRGGELGRGDPS